MSEPDYDAIFARMRELLTGFETPVEIHALYLSLKEPPEFIRYQDNDEGSEY